MNFTVNDLYVALAIVAVCGILMYIPKTQWWKRHVCDECEYISECFECNKGTCVGCEHFHPLTGRVKQAYVKREDESGKVVASTTLTFDKDFVINQHPVGGDDPWQIPDMVGIYKSSVWKWVNNATPLDRRFVSFIPE